MTWPTKEKFFCHINCYLHQNLVGVLVFSPASLFLSIDIWTIVRFLPFLISSLLVYKFFDYLPWLTCPSVISINYLSISLNLFYPWVCVSHSFSWLVAIFSLVNLLPHFSSHLSTCHYHPPTVSLVLCPPLFIFSLRS